MLVRYMYPTYQNQVLPGVTYVDLYVGVLSMTRKQNHRPACVKGLRWINLSAVQHVENLFALVSKASIKSHTSRATDVEIQDDITGKGGRFKWLKNDTFRAVFVNTVAAAVALLWCNTYDVLRQ
ncbi:hypothetical protein L6164_034905 [Bauhinia variegata]|uniref:Uncharacterized protein n=1 Tax=Bauhinia variegata TaxID=167791 RepID=A0ACB9KWA4_BAUVA|nr:hypothetical protein L6164_034905 [Bauhinia variegata]